MERERSISRLPPARLLLRIELDPRQPDQDPAWRPLGAREDAQPTEPRWLALTEHFSACRGLDSPVSQKLGCKVPAG